MLTSCSAGPTCRGRAAARAANLDYFEVVGVGMSLEHHDPNPRKAVHIVWGGEKVQADDDRPAPQIDETEEVEPGKPVVTAAALVRMKLQSFCDQDRVHLRDLIDVGLVERSFIHQLPAELAARLDGLLADAGL